MNIQKTNNPSLSDCHCKRSEAIPWDCRACVPQRHFGVEARRFAPRNDDSHSVFVLISDFILILVDV
jgi:hypothetical protein